MLYICIPVFDEAPTVGLVLWKLRKVLQEYSREYEVVIYDDGSTDGTREALAPYADVLPLTIIGGPKRQGYAAALDGLVRHVTARTRYPRRDAMIVMQGDLTDQPEDVPELARRFEGGADIVVAERPAKGSMPQPVERLRRFSGWMSRRGTVRLLGADRVVRPALFEIPGVADPFGSLRLFRISVLRDLVKARGDAPIVENSGWAANAELLLRASGHARRVESMPSTQRFDLRPRGSRIRPWADARALFQFSRTAASLAKPAAVPPSRRA
ncbi:MAG TPA: glycosyltransferase family 2 protein [Gemmatimonadaceae bacterium]|nr:glycosyltransferase family 2 protein [Gemmatimonadaceae bacterium]